MNLLNDLLKLKRQYQHDYKILFGLFTLFSEVNTKICELKTNLDNDEKYFSNILKRLNEENEVLKQCIENLEDKCENHHLEEDVHD